jgi:pimeloyl-ACP methyl ester carboxylesterase
VPEASVNGVSIYYELHGTGEPLALVHGSWMDARSWGLVVPALADSFRVLVYDRRGHSRSERPEAPGSVDEDGDDLAALLEALGLAPAHVAANSWGGNVSLRLAVRRPELFRSLACHEPPLWELLAGDPEGQRLLDAGAASVEGVANRIAAGDHEAAARQFVDEVAFGPGAWDSQVPEEAKETMVRNAPTFLDEQRDPNQLGIDERALARLELPVRFTCDPDCPPVFGRVIDRLVEQVPNATRATIDGGGHIPHVQAPERFVELVSRV